jgi:hypothetical protein
MSLEEEKVLEDDTQSPVVEDKQETEFEELEEFEEEVEQAEDETEKEQEEEAIPKPKKTEQHRAINQQIAAARRKAEEEAKAAIEKYEFAQSQLKQITKSEISPERLQEIKQKAENSGIDESILIEIEESKLDRQKNKAKEVLAEAEIQKEKAKEVLLKAQVTEYEDNGGDFEKLQNSKGFKEFAKERWGKMSVSDIADLFMFRNGQQQQNKENREKRATGGFSTASSSILTPKQQKLLDDYNRVASKEEKMTPREYLNRLKKPIF